MEVEEDDLPSTIEAEVHAKLLSQSSGDEQILNQSTNNERLRDTNKAPSATGTTTTTDFEWKPDEEAEPEMEPETQALLSDEQSATIIKPIKSSRYRNTDV